MNARTMTRKQIASLKAKGARYIAYVHYTYDGNEKYDVLSWHKTYDAAAKAAKSQFHGVMEVSQIEPVEDFEDFVNSVA